MDRRLAALLVREQVQATLAPCIPAITGVACTAKFRQWIVSNPANHPAVADKPAKGRVRTAVEDKMA